MIDYTVFGLDKDSSKEDVDSAYARLKKEYRGNMFLAGEEGAESARALERLEAEYKKFSEVAARPAEKTDFAYIEDLLKKEKTAEAQQELDKITERPAEWHFAQAIVYYKKSWFSECRKHLETAIKMDPQNKKYKDNYVSLLAYSEILEQKRRSEEEERAKNGSKGGDCCSGNSGSCTAPCLSDCCFRDED